MTQSLKKKCWIKIKRPSTRWVIEARNSSTEPAHGSKLGDHQILKYLLCPFVGPGNCTSDRNMSSHHAVILSLATCNPSDERASDPLLHLQRQRKSAKAAGHCLEERQGGGQGHAILWVINTEDFVVTWRTCSKNLECYCCSREQANPYRLVIEPWRLDGAL